MKENVFSSASRRMWHGCPIWSRQIWTVKGNAQVILDIEPVYHYWRVAGQNGPQKVLGAWTFDKCGEASYMPGSRKNIRDAVEIEISEKGGGSEVCRQINYGGGIKEDASPVVNTLRISAGKENAGKSAAVMVGTLQPIPDVAVEHLDGVLHDHGRGRMYGHVKACSVMNGDMTLF